MNTHGPYLVPPDARERLLGRPPSPLFRYYDETMGGILEGNVALRAQVTPEYVRSGIERYDTAIRYSTDALGALLDELERAGRFDDALIVVTADHGEEFFEHGGFSHGYTLHEEAVRVPLIVKLPGQREPRAIEARVSLLDVLPTIVDAVGAKLEAPVEGASLVPLIRGEGPAPARGAIRLTAEFSPRLVGSAWIEGDEKLLSVQESYDGQRGAAHLYDLRADPGERRDLAGERPQRTAELAARLRDAAPAPAAASDLAEGLDAERLRALGYAR
jgi:arylsulfatase A-like enzyme